jgi:hypothetical protein
MHREFAVKPLSSRLVQKTYPFAQAIGIADLPSWRRYIATYVSGRADGRRASGGIVAETPQGYVCGLLLYQANRHNREGAVLVCDPFLVADLPRYDTPVRALLEAADRIAVELGCKWVRVVLPASGDPLGPEGSGCEASLFRAGYALESLSFRRRRSLPARKPVVAVGGKPSSAARINAR